MKRSIVWLASYPKSGNTWVRIFLANYLSNAQKPIPINQLTKFGTGDSGIRFYEAVAGRKLDRIDAQTTLKLRDGVLRGIVGNNADVNFVKTHATRMPVMGQELIRPEVTRCAIYIVRNPLDVLLSYARHFGLSHAETAKVMERRDNAISPDSGNVWQFLGNWSDHVQSWAAPAPFPVVFLRYEDLLADPRPHFTRMLQQIGFPVEPERFDRAIRFSSFDELSRQEAETGFKEASKYNESFFAKGTSGNWTDDMSPELAKIMRKTHRKGMKKNGYLE